MAVPDYCGQRVRGLASAFTPVILCSLFWKGTTVPLQPALRSTASPQTVLRGTVNPSSTRMYGGGFGHRGLVSAGPGASSRYGPRSPPSALQHSG